MRGDISWAHKQDARAGSTVDAVARRQSALPV